EQVPPPPKRTERRPLPNGLEVGQASPAQVDTPVRREYKLQSERKKETTSASKIHRKKKRAAKYYGKSVRADKNEEETQRLETNNNAEMFARCAERGTPSKTRNRKNSS
ncbi:hypothetical protein IscW_ISCW020084, partial [Ixodes scapularis]